MPITQLLASSGNTAVDAVLQNAITALDAQFGQRVRGYYLVGSYAIGCAIASSDVDLVALCCDTASSSERAAFQCVLRELRATTSLSIDITLFDEAELRRVGATRFKVASVLLQGEDVRERIPLRSIEAYARSEMAAGATSIFRTRGNPVTLHMPLTAPLPQDAFLGYAARRMKFPDGTEHASTKDLVNAVVLLGTAIVAAEARQYVYHKSQLVAVYQRHIGDAWADHIETVYTFCRATWGYLVPQSLAERQQLRQLCEREVAFERAFVPRFRACCAQARASGSSAWAEEQLARFTGPT